MNSSSVPSKVQKNSNQPYTGQSKGFDPYSESPYSEGKNVNVDFSKGPHPIHPIDSPAPLSAKDVEALDRKSIYFF